MFSGIQEKRTAKSILLIKTFLGLVEMMFGLVNASFSLPKWQAVEMTFFACWLKSAKPHRPFKVVSQLILALIVVS